jgi:prepilin-type N-terminal cleavage/methylation domain-containing protein
MVKKTKRKYNKGFTLIELLIVIAIIGILASVVLVSLSSARDKARIANFKSQIASMQAAAIIACDGDVAAITDISGLIAVPADSGITVADTVADNDNCGLDGNGTFDITVTAGLPSACTAATFTQAGVIFTGC